MSKYEVISLVLEGFVVLLLLAEYFYGRPDRVVRNETKQKRRLREKYTFERLTDGEHK